MKLLDLKIQYLNKNNHMGLKAGQKTKEKEVSDLKSDLVTWRDKIEQTKQTGGDTAQLAEGLLSLHSLGFCFQHYEIRWEAHATLTYG